MIISKISFIYYILEGGVKYMNELLLDEEDGAIFSSCILGLISVLSSTPVPIDVLVPAMFNTAYLKGDITIDDMGVSKIDDHLTYGIMF